MFTQILIGSAINIASVFVLVLFVEIGVREMQKRLQIDESTKPSSLQFFLALSLIMFWLLLAMSFMIWFWTFLLMGVGVFHELEESLYFSLVAFTTLGFGDITLPDQWRLLSGFIAANGFLMFGLITAVLMEAIIRLR